jgi:hypothetical protein
MTAIKDVCGTAEAVPFQDIASTDFFSAEKVPDAVPSATEVAAR